MAEEASGSGRDEPDADKGVSGLDGPVSRRLNRPVSRRISSRVARHPMTPNQWSGLAFGAVCAGALAFAARLPRLGAVLVHAGSVLDGVDGEVARLQGTASPSGALLDLALDRVSDVAVAGGLAAGAGGRGIDWLLALASTSGVLTSGIVKERLGAEGKSVAGLQREEARASAVDRLLPWTGRDGRLLAVTVAGLLRAPRLGLLWLAVTSNVRLVRRLAAARALLEGREG
jgi:CDP-L-myo-inositol myo-inositolphosphotransferase